MSTDKKLRARLPLALQNHWVLLHDPAGAAEHAELLVIVGDGSSQDSRAKLLEDAARRAPSMLGRLRDAARDGGRVVAEDRVAVGAGFPGTSEALTESFPTDAFPPGPGGGTGYPGGGFPGGNASSPGGTGFPGTGFPGTAGGVPGDGASRGTGFSAGGSGFPPASDDPNGGTGFPGSSR